MTLLDRHLPLEAYFLALQSVGLVVEAWREPRPDDAAVSDHPAMADGAGSRRFCTCGR
jgi:hypothetical protein